MQIRKIIFFELNEVPYRVIDKFCELYPNSSFAHILPQSHQYETYAADADRGYLSPTKTWPTLHRGVASDQHGLTSFGQAVDEADQQYPPIWKLITAHGLKVGICGSLFSYPLPESLENYAFYLPDTFAQDNSAYPENFASFQKFNLAMSRASSRNVSTKIDWKSALELLPNLSSLGLSHTTFINIGQQLVTEKFNSKLKTRRRTIQSILSFDIFLKQLKLNKPDFVTFFSNHVAATMHRYWAASFPEDYNNFQLKNEWVKSFRNEINFVMQKSDELLNQLVKFVNSNCEYVLYVVSSMGQAALKAEHITSWLSIQDFPKLMNRLGFEAPDYEQRPAMAPIFNLVVAENKIAEFRDRTSQLMVDGKKIVKERKDGFFQFTFENYHNYQGPEYAELNGVLIPFAELGLANAPHEDEVYLTADHIPQGVMLVYDPKNQVKNTIRTQISTLDIAPSILKNFGIPLPSYMQQGLHIAR